MGGFKKNNGTTGPGSHTGESLESKTLQRNPGMISRAVSLSVKNRLAVVSSVFGLMVVVEIVEQVVTILFGEQVHLFYDSFIFLVVVPAGAWLLLRLLKEMDMEREQAQVSSDLHTEFSQKLGDARSWDELILQIIAYPHRLVPQAHITLFTMNPADQGLQPAVACDCDGHITVKPEDKLNPGSQPVGSLPQLLLQQDSVVQPAQSALVEAFFRRQANSGPAPLPPHRYDLPITHNGEQIGVIKLDFPPGMAPAADQIRALKAAAPVMGLALEGALLQQVAAEQAAASQAQRQEIAQTLHDTLAQNVGYLRLKLDQLTGENAIREIGVVLQELERMRLTADEAYQQVRNTLDELNPPPAGNLVSTLFKQCRSISQRAGFSLRTSQMGRQRNLSGPIHEQILYIVREALYNVEKHARANQVHLQFIWLDCEVIIKITDDGVGFDPNLVPAEGHYGLWIMQRRAQEIGGTLKIGPAADGSDGAPGTEVTLWVPCPSHKVPAASFFDTPFAQPDSVAGAASEHSHSVT